MKCDASLNVIKDVIKDEIKDVASLNVIKDDASLNVMKDVIKDTSFNEEDPLLKSFKINYIFYTTLIICLYMISHYTNSSFIWCIISFLYISFKGYFVHYFSHKLDLLKTYSELNNYFTRNPVLNTMTIWFCNMFDFHRNIHHDSSINKRLNNKIYEFIINFLTQTGLFFVFIYFTKHLNYYVCLLWGLFYSTVHMINYDIIKPISHKNHHVDYNTNYDIIFWDTFFDTKYDYNDTLEDINLCSINVIVLTLLIVCFVKYNNSQDI